MYDTDNPLSVIYSKYPSSTSLRVSVALHSCISMMCTLLYESLTGTLNDTRGLLDLVINSIAR